MNEGYKNIPVPNSLDYMEGVKENNNKKLKPEEKINLDKDKGGISVETIKQVYEHVGETFTSEIIQVPEEKIRSYLDVIGDINPIHFDSNRVGESVLVEPPERRILVPGFLTLALLSNGSAIYEALKIKEPYEVSLPAIEGTKWRFPIFAGSDIVFKLTLKEVGNYSIKKREGVITKWKAVAYAEVAEKIRPCMTTEVTLIYSNLSDTLS